MSNSVSPLVNVGAGSPAFAAGGAAKTRASREEIAGAAQQFEALMLNQLLQSAFAADKENGLGGEEDQAGMQAMQLAQEHFAEALSARGGIGLAQMIAARLFDQTGGNTAESGSATGSTHPPETAGTKQ